MIVKGKHTAHTEVVRPQDFREGGVMDNIPLLEPVIQYQNYIGGPRMTNEMCREKQAGGKTGYSENFFMQFRIIFKDKTPVGDRDATMLYVTALCCKTQHTWHEKALGFSVLIG